MTFTKEIINAISYATSNGYQIHPDAFALLKGLENDILELIKSIIKVKNDRNEKSLIVLDDVKDIIKIDKKNLNTHKEISRTVNENVTEQEYKVLESSTDLDTAEGVDGFASLFKSRYYNTMNILSHRPESKRIISISQLKERKIVKDTSDNLNSKNNKNNDSTFIAGLIMSRKINRNYIQIVVDDMTGILNLMVNDDELMKQTSMLALDQMVMVEVEKTIQQKYIVKKINSPDIPDHIPNRSKTDSYVVLISDLHVGSKHFLSEKFHDFLSWLSQTDDEIVNKIKYICIGGDVIDGIGIFPNQDKELVDLNIIDQVKHATDLISRIPSHIKIFVIPGNHDPGRRALPQPPIPYRYSKRIYSLPNVLMLGNPSMLSLDGVKILMYHGQSLDDIIATTPGCSYAKPAEAMKILLKARHLSPTFGQRTPLAPEKEDKLVINEVPDILHSGHVHIADVQSYKGTLIVNSGTWQGQTKFQQTMGIDPTPAIAILVNLSTLQPFKIDFNQFSLT